MRLKLLFFASLFAMVTSVASAEDVRSTNIHGVIRVDTTTTNVLIAVPWTFYTPTGQSDTNLPVDHLVWPVNLDDGDLLMMVTPQSLKTEGKYESWMLTRDLSTGAGTWTPALTASLQGDSEPQPDRQITRGYGLWLIRQNPKDSSGNWKPFYLYGQYAEGSASVSVSNATEAANPVMIANPCCQDLAVNVDIEWTGVSTNDTLSLPNGTDAWDLGMWDTASNAWYVAKSERVGRKIVNKRYYNLTVPAGHGFWYIRRTPGEIDITFNAK